MAARGRRRNRFAALHAELAGLAARFPGRLGLVAHDLRSGARLDIDADGIYPTASLFKVPLLLELLLQAHEGAVSLDYRRRIEVPDVLPGSGVLKDLTAGIELTVRDLAVLMTTVSDNTATDILWELVGGADAVRRPLGLFGLSATRIDLNARGLLLESVGMPRARGGDNEAVTLARRLRKTAFEFEASVFLPERSDGPANATSPRDVSRLFEGLESGSSVPPPVRRLALDVLGRQQLRDRIPLMLPRSAKVAHKTGTLGTTRNDSGIVYTRRGPVVLVALGRDVGLARGFEADLLIARIARAVYDSGT